jgi:hypothetical protein
MRLIIATLAVLLCAAAAQPAGAATRKERERVCAHRGFTVAKSPTARLFETDRGGDRTLYGCLRAGGRLQTLASWFSCDCSVGDETGPSAELIAGHFALLTATSDSCGPVPSGEECTVSTSYALRNLRSRRDFSPQGEVSQIATGAGFFAYVDGRVVVVRGGRELMADAGPGIEPGSLALAGPRLYWMRDGLPQSALVQ